MDRWTELRATAYDKAYVEAQRMDVLKHLPLEQRTSAGNLIAKLAAYETFRGDEEFSNDSIALANLYSAVLALKEAIDKDVPREVLLTILDKDFLTPRPVQGAHHCGGG